MKKLDLTPSERLARRRAQLRAISANRRVKLKPALLRLGYNSAEALITALLIDGCITRKLWNHVTKLQVK